MMIQPLFYRSLSTSLRLPPRRRAVHQAHRARQHRGEHLRHPLLLLGLRVEERAERHGARVRQQPEVEQPRGPGGPRRTYEG